MTVEESLRRYGVEQAGLYYAPGSETEVLSRRQIRVLAVGAPIFWDNDEPMKALPNVRPELLQDCKQHLREWWDISNREQALATLDSLVQTGHRATLHERLAKNRPYWDRQFNRLKFLQTRPMTSVGGWDYVRIVTVARWSLDYGYLDAATAWHYMHLGAHLAQLEFTSWDELATSFIAGRLMWNRDVKGNKQLARQARYLLEQPGSIWHEYPWEEYAAVPLAAEAPSAPAPASWFSRLWSRWQNQR